MEYISVFDMLKIGVGPSSSHTLGPWKAALEFIKIIQHEDRLSQLNKIQIHLYGSLSLTGKGHATDIAVLLGLCGFQPDVFPTNLIAETIDNIKNSKQININQKKIISFIINSDIVFEQIFLPFHPNGIKFEAYFDSGEILTEKYYSIGGGFVIQENVQAATNQINPFPFPIETSSQLLNYCKSFNKNISQIVAENEKSLRSEQLIDQELSKIWQVMLACMYDGCHTPGILPGGLHVKRRAFDLHAQLLPHNENENAQSWFEAIRKLNLNFKQIMSWISCWALAVNEVNASLGRVVTAPTNGSAGVIPAVLMYYLCFENKLAGFEEIKKYFFVCGEIGSIFKKGSTISAAAGGCQAEIGVSSAMAAAGLCDLFGGTPEQVLMAAEIAMEHHLGLTCDPIKGLVQIPCIERNTMGATKAIQAAILAFQSDAKVALVSLDEVIKTMWLTAQDMNIKYKETSTGGLALAVNMINC
ncbi:MAG: L-serine ammonia-lyase [Sediminibacterium sp.]|nr:L-serine ammonia-lyase [Sediminibacterium sp.]